MNLLHKLAATLVLGVACAIATGQTLRWSSQGDIQTLDPHSQNEQLTNGINAQVYESLIKRDRQLGLAPALALDWSPVSPTLWRMRLRPGVKFHDGSPFTAGDVVFSINRAKHPASGFRAYAE